MYKHISSIMETIDIHKTAIIQKQRGMTLWIG